MVLELCAVEQSGAALSHAMVDGLQAFDTVMLGPLRAALTVPIGCR